MAEGEGESEDTLQKALQIELVSLILCWKTFICDSPLNNRSKRTMV